MNTTLSICDRARFMRFVEKVPEAGCWIWTGTTAGWSEYGQFTLQGKQRLAHVVSYEHHVSPVPAGLEMDHKCRVRLCVNPDHLEPVTRAENIRRRTAAKTHCRNGHPLSGPDANVRLVGNTRVCRTCVAENMRRFKARREAAA